MRVNILKCRLVGNMRPVKSYPAMIEVTCTLYRHTFSNFESAKA